MAFGMDDAERAAASLAAKPKFYLCGRQRTIKDRRRRRVDTIFGQVRVPAPRFEPCRCGQIGDLSPVTSLFPHRSTPELRHLQVKLGGEFSYRQAATLLQQFLPDSDRFNHTTIRNRVLKIGQEIEAEDRRRNLQQADAGHSCGQHCRRNRWRICWGDPNT